MRYSRLDYKYFQITFLDAYAPGIVLDFASD